MSITKSETVRRPLAINVADKVQKLIIGNVDGESQVGEPEKLSRESVIGTSIVANRLTWLAKEGDILLLPAPISQDFLNYVTDLMDVERASVQVVTPKGATLEETHTLVYEELANEELIEKLNGMMSENPAKWQAVPYYFDRAVAFLSQHVPVTMNPSLQQYFLQGGAEMLNSKIEFRRIAAAFDIPVPEGINCYTRPELARALRSLIDVTGSVIIKQDYNAGGDGNIVLTRDPNRTQSLGATETHRISSVDEIPQWAETMWNRLIGTRNTILVVEAYYDTQSVFYSELEIKEGGLRPYLLNFGDMRMEPVWNGFEIPSLSLNAYAIGEFASCSMQLAEVARQRGYVGKINCDGVLTSEGKVFFTEINGRLGGCTHIHVVAEHLYGANYGDRYTLLTRNKIKVGWSFSELLQRLAEANLLVTGPHQTGVVVLTEDLERSGAIEYLVVGDGQEHAKQLEQQALALFEGSVLA
ncbi:MAG: preATP grasp domain-containing protein [Tumebacillaceae bacterium]